jgi:uncharacterized protein (TIGR03437 family)
VTNLRPLVLLLSSVPFCWAQSGPSGPPDIINRLTVASFAGSGTDSVQAIATDPGGKIYVAGTTSSPDFPVLNAAQPNMAETRLSRSVNRGASWTAVGSPPILNPTVVTADPITPGILFTGGAEGIAKSTDGGQTWRLVYSSSDAGIASIVIMPEKPSRVLAESAGLIASDDGGETWAPVKLSASGYALQADPGGSGTVILLGTTVSFLVSRDEGRTWALTRPAPFAPQIVALDPLHPGWIYANGQGLIWLSTDFGASWTLKTTPSFGLPLSGLLVDPEQANRLYVTTLTGKIYISTDGAATWTASQQGSITGGSFPTSNPGCSSGVRFTLSHGFVPGAVARSLDFGRTWETVPSGPATDLAIGAGCALYITRPIQSDAFIAKLSPGGTEVLWSTFLGGIALDQATALAVDSAGNVYVTGSTQSSDFPSTAAPIGPLGSNNAFVTKYDTSGHLVYSVLLGGIATKAIAADSQGNAYVGGANTNPNASPTGSVTALDSVGALLFSSMIGATVAGIAIDLNGQVLTVGSTDRGAPIPITPDALQGPPGINFLARLDSSGSFTYATYLGGTKNTNSFFSSTASAVTTDAQGNVYVAAATRATDFPITPGAYFSGLRSETCHGTRVGTFPIGSGDLYVMKLNAQDLQPVYAALLGSECGTAPGALAVDSQGNVAVSASGGLGFPLHTPVADMVYTGTVAQLDSTGSSLLWSSFLTTADFPAIAYAPDGSLYAGVTFTSSMHGAVLRLPISVSAPVSVDSVANAFSGFTDEIYPGSLVSVMGSNLAPDFVDLGLNPRQPLPTQVAGVQVLFDGLPAPLLQTSPGRLICVAPAITHQTVALQVVNALGASNQVIVSAAGRSPGLLTRSFPDVVPYEPVPDGAVRNEDGSVNDVDHPAAPGSQITVYATGLGVTPGIDPGSIATEASAPVTPVYAWWSTGAVGLVNAATTMPGFIAAVMQVNVTVPAIQSTGSVQRLILSLQFYEPHSAGLSALLTLPLPFDAIALYVK